MDLTSMSLSEHLYVNIWENVKSDIMVFQPSKHVDDPSESQAHNVSHVSLYNPPS